MKRSPMRKVACPECGYTVRMARSWMDVGMPSCPCGQTMAPVAPADLAWIGAITIDDVPRREWTEICRENGWQDAIVRKGNAAKMFERREQESGGFAARLRHAKPQCSYTGCGKWVAAGSEYCHEHSPQLAAMPF